MVTRYKGEQLESVSAERVGSKRIKEEKNEIVLLLKLFYREPRTVIVSILISLVFGLVIQQAQPFVFRASSAFQVPLNLYYVEKYKNSGDLNILGRQAESIISLSEQLDVQQKLSHLGGLGITELADANFYINSDNLVIVEYVSLDADVALNVVSVFTEYLNFVIKSFELANIEQEIALVKKLDIASDTEGKNYVREREVHLFLLKSLLLENDVDLLKVVAESKLTEVRPHLSVFRAIVFSVIIGLILGLSVIIIRLSFKREEWRIVS